MSKNLLFILCLIFLSCGDYRVIPPPFSYVSVEVSTEICENFNYIGIIYTIKNFSSKIITGMNISFYLYSGSDGRPVPDMGSNFFRIAYQGGIGPDEELRIASSLDDKFWYVPVEEVLAENFHISSVIYEDGSSWEDTTGLYIFPDVGE